MYEWYEYYAYEPFLADRIEIQLATIANMIASFGKSKLKHSDFMVSHKVQKELTLEEKQASIKAKFAMFM